MSQEKAKKIPEMCIIQTRGVTYCGRDVSEKECTFTDAAYAVSRYATGTALRACPTCVDYATDLLSMRKAQLEPMATRGLEKK